jgi:hypothetical protein
MASFSILAAWQCNNTFGPAPLILCRLREDVPLGARPNDPWTEELGFACEGMHQQAIQAPAQHARLAAGRRTGNPRTWHGYQASIGACLR